MIKIILPSWFHMSKRLKTEIVPGCRLPQPECKGRDLLQPKRKKKWNLKFKSKERPDHQTNEELRVTHCLSGLNVG